MRTCKGCRFNSPTRVMDLPQCAHPDNLAPDYVNGGTRMTHSAEWCRDTEKSSHCGPEGRHWRAKDDSPILARLSIDEARDILSDVSARLASTYDTDEDAGPLADINDAARELVFWDHAEDRREMEQSRAKDEAIQNRREYE